jgi:hypothetical protein
MSTAFTIPGAPEMLETGRIMNGAASLAGRGAFDLPPWIFPPVDGRELFTVASAPATGYGVEQLLVSYRVPAGFEAIITGLLHTYEGTGFVPGSGDILWTVDIDRQSGAVIPSGRVVEGFLRVAVPLGSYERPWPIPAGIRLKPLETIRYKATPIATVALGAGTALNAAFSGYLWPVK